MEHDQFKTPEFLVHQLVDIVSKNGNLRNIHRKFGQSVHELFLLVLCKMPLRLGVKFPYSDFKCRNTLCGLIGCGSA